MSKIILSPRLKLVFDRVPACAEYIDVGTDHAYLPAALLMQGRISFATVTDVREGPLEKAKQTADKFDLVARMRFVLADGLRFDFGKPEAVSICGMGGHLIARILDEANLPKNCTLLLQPMTKHEVLRRYLFENGYDFKESFANEGSKVYMLLSAKKTNTPQEFCEVDLYAGRPEQNTAEYEVYLKSWIAKLEKRIKGLESSSKTDEAAICSIKSLMLALEERLSSF